MAKDLTIIHQSWWDSCDGASCTAVLEKTEEKE